MSFVGLRTTMNTTTSMEVRTAPRMAALVGKRTEGRVPGVVLTNICLGLGLTPWPCGILGFSDSIPLRRDETEEG